MFAKVKKNKKMVELINDIQQILRIARQKTLASINLVMVQAYWLIGRRIVEEEQGGEKRAQYGKELLKNLSENLQNEFGKGFSVDNLGNMRKFYLEYSIPQKVSAEFGTNQVLNFRDTVSEIQKTETLKLNKSIR